MAEPVEVVLAPALEPGRSEIFAVTEMSPWARTSASGEIEAVAMLLALLQATAPAALNLPSLMPGKRKVVMRSAVAGLSLPVAPRMLPTTLRWMPALKLVILAEIEDGLPSVAALAEVDSSMSALALISTLPDRAWAVPPSVAVVSELLSLIASARPTPLPPVFLASAAALIRASVRASTLIEPPVVWVPAPTSARVVMWVLARTKVASTGLLIEFTEALTSISVSVAASIDSALVATILLVPSTRVRASAVDSPQAAENRKGLLKVGLAAETACELIVTVSAPVTAVAPSISVVALAVESATSGTELKSKKVSSSVVISAPSGSGSQLWSSSVVAVPRIL